MAEFTLMDLAPEPLTFRDRQGNRHEVKRPNQFGLISLAKFDKLQREQAQLMQKLQGISSGSNDKALRQAEQDLEAVLDDMVTMLAPALPDEVKTSMGFLERIAFIRWWSAETASDQVRPVGEAPAGKTEPAKKATRKKSSPASSDTTG
jgi:plasmid maintenance system killer protein